MGIMESKKMWVALDNNTSASHLQCECLSINSVNTTLYTHVYLKHLPHIITACCMHDTIVALLQW